jgi:hypothetical protein
VSGGGTVLLTDAEIIKQALEFRDSRDYHPDGYNAELVEQPEIVQIPVIELRLVVPLNFDADAALVVIDPVCWDINFIRIYTDTDVKLLLVPPSTDKEAIQLYGDSRASAPSDNYGAALQPECTKAIEDVLPLGWKITR